MQSKRTDYFRSSPAWFTGTQSPRVFNPVQVAKTPNNLFQNESQNSFFWKILLVSCFWVFYPNEEPENLVSSATGSHCEPQGCSNSSSSQFKLLISELELGVWATLSLNSPELMEKKEGHSEEPCNLDLSHKYHRDRHQTVTMPQIRNSCCESSNKSYSSWVKMLISFITLTPNKWLKPRLNSFCFQPFSTP